MNQREPTKASDVALSGVLIPKANKTDKHFGIVPSDKVSEGAHLLVMLLSIFYLLLDY